MGYGFMVFAVDFAAVRACAASGDDKVRRSISGRFKVDIASTNDQLGWSNERGEPGVFTALKHLIMGEPLTLEGAMYGYAYKYIVEFFGRSLDNSHFYPCSSSFAEAEIDPELAKVGLAARMSNLAFGESLIKFPHPADFPGFGYWTHEQVSEDAAKAATISSTNEHVTQVVQWVRHAHASRRGIVSFYH